MPSLSKNLFYKNINEKQHCHAVHYWETDCVKAVFFSPFVASIAKGSAKFFLPIYIVKLLLNYKKINDIKFIRRLLIAEVTSMVYGVTMGSILISSICLLRQIFGRIHYYNVVFFPGIASGLALLLESEENQVLDTLIFFNSFVEAVINNVNAYVYKITIPIETLLFMIISSALMYLLENRKKELNMTYFWFYTPTRNTNEIEEQIGKVCIHPFECRKFWTEGLAKYFTLGYSVNIIRRLLPKMGTLFKKPKGFLNILFHKSNVKFGLFFGGYVSIYRILQCYLVKWGRIRRKYHSMIAGFLSGLAYIIYPNKQTLTIGITTFLQMIYGNVSEKLNIQSNFWPRQLLYMFCHGSLLHNKIFYPETCPSYYKNMMDACTNDMIPRMYENIISKYFQEIAKEHKFKYFTGA